MSLHDWGPRSALIGSTGFVGGNLLRQGRFDRQFHRTDIETMRGGDFSVVVCAGVSAVKWRANQQPEEDWRGIEPLLDVLRTIRAERMVLISTVDVFADPNGVTEDTPPSLENHAYGRHRRQVEEFVRETFPVHHIARLPGLFGPGLKKNVIYDLLHGNCLEAIQPRSAYQYYPLAFLTADLLKMIGQGLDTLHFATEPLETSVLHACIAPNRVIGEKAGPVVRYDMRTKHGGYLHDAETVLQELDAFVKS
jgi:hypothetical protein